MPDGITDALLIYNPTSGRRRHRRFVEVEHAARTLKDAGIRTELAPTEGPNSATEITRLAVDQRRGMVIACGGDGTVNEVVNGLAGSDVPMALLPAGTANILAKELRIPWDIPQAARLIPTGVVRRVALGKVVPPNGNGSASPAIPKGGRYFLCVGGAGPDGAIVNGVDSGFKKNAGELAYWAEGLRQLFTYNFPEMRVRSNGHELRATTVVVGRTVNYGGPFKITTGASLYDNSFEILTNSMTSRLGYASCLPALWMGKLRDMEGIDAWKSTEVLCESAGPEPAFAQVDGEPVGPLPLVFRVVPDALSLVTPQ
ncbi:MAG TPA: diacylglycerol kinase family protein [Candidatus Aquilonibacter sp.]|nr:diacylglycerol kinase family protein [Candidatus Aquilonibacter sp.]